MLAILACPALGYETAQADPPIGGSHHKLTLGYCGSEKKNRTYLMLLEQNDLFALIILGLGTQVHFQKTPESRLV